MGSLFIAPTNAISDFGEKKINAPAPTIQFSAHEGNTAALLGYIAHATNSNIYEATEAFDHFCDHLKSEMETKAAAKLPGICWCNE